MKLVFLWSDVLIYLLVISISLFFYQLSRSSMIRERWHQVFNNRLGMVTFVVLLSYISIALLDSLHFREALKSEPTQPANVVYYDNRVLSVLDVLLGDINHEYERTYSAPFALKSFNKESMKDDEGKNYRDFPPLRHAGIHLPNTEQASSADIWRDVLWQSGIALFIGLLISALLIGPQWLVFRGSTLPWKTAWIAQAAVVCLAAWLIYVGNLYHILGTDQAGNDVLYRTLKGIRTAVLLGTLATLIMLPIAVSLGIAAGYFKGWVDDVVQYLYTTLSSIPGILLISASVLMFQIYIELSPDIFEVGLQRADAKFVALCFILGVTSWATLCRLMRAETLKISQLDYVQAAHAFGVSHLRIIFRHVLPNVVHIILITFVLEFSGLVLAEAVLSYIGVGIDPPMASWGNMIYDAQKELSREPIIWWGLAGTFFFMFALVLAANLFSDLVRDAFDPRTATVNTEGQ